MSRQTRRTFLKTSGALLGAMAAGTAVTAATSTDRFIVKSKKVSESDLSDAGLSVVHDLDAIGYLVVEGSEADVDGLGAKYAPDTTYQFNQPVDDAPVTESSETTDEPLYGFQWDKQVQDLPDAHDLTRGEGTRVSVIDTGVDAAHPDLAHAVNTDLSLDFTGDGYGSGGPFGGYHGTHVAGIIAANDQNDVGTVGTAPATEVVDCRVFSPDSLASFADIVAAMVYSAEVGCDAANLSLGAYPVERQANGDFYGKVLNSTTSYCRRNGTLLIAAAGNDSADLQHDGRICGDFDEDGDSECVSAISLPNEAANVMSVSATGPIGFEWGEDGLAEPPESPAFYTNYGTNAIDVAAPGGDADLETTNPNYYLDLVLSTISEPVFDEDDNYLGASRGYGWAAGTSMACPQVVGAAALVKSANPNYHANKVRNALRRTASVPDGYDKTYYGKGFIDLVGAVQD